MRRLRANGGQLRRSERGYTLIELLVAAAIGMIVLGGAVTIFVGAVRSEPRTASKISALQEGRVAVERITRDLRQGIEAPTALAAELEVVTYVKEDPCGGAPAAEAQACLVTYDCAEEACTRTVSEPDGGSPGTAVEVVSGLASTEVFTYSASEPESEPTYVGVELSFSTVEGGPVTIADGVTLRNGAS